MPVGEMALASEGDSATTAQATLRAFFREHELLEPLSGVSLKPTGERRANAATPREIKRQRLR